MSNVLITGGSGLIGTRLTTLLLQRGHKVWHLGRKKEEGDIPSYTWDIPTSYIEPGALKNKDAIIHLAGAGIADKPWTEKRKKEILESRTKSTRLLCEELKKGKHSIQNVVSSSAVGYYGFRNPDEKFTEDKPAGSDFLASVTAAWEHEADKIQELGIPLSKVRTGIVLSNNGGVLKSFSTPIKFYVGSPLGSGDQYISWIHIDDHCNIIIKLLEEKQSGPFNSVAPHAVTNRELTKVIARVLKKPLILPAVPAFLLKALLGEMADLVLYGSNVLPKRVEEIGYQFEFEEVDDAVRDLLKVR